MIDLNNIAGQPSDHEFYPVYYGRSRTIDWAMRNLLFIFGLAAEKFPAQKSILSLKGVATHLAESPTMEIMMEQELDFHCFTVRLNRVLMGLGNVKTF